MKIVFITISRRLKFGFCEWAISSKPVVLVLLVVFCFSCSTLFAASTTNSVRISVLVDGKSVPSHEGKRLKVTPDARELNFSFGPSQGNAVHPLCYRCRLEGFENTWHKGDGFMYLAVRFVDATGNLIDQRIFEVFGENPGWNGALNTTALTHRRETLVIPPDTRRASVVISSAGPPSTVGVYVVANLTMSELSSNNSSATILLQSPFDQVSKSNMPINSTPAGWVRDGLISTMAKVVQIGQDLPVKAFAIEDMDISAHAEWRMVAQSVVPGDHLVIEWNEAFTIGDGTFSHVVYPGVKPGDYRFRVVGVDLFGNPDGPEGVLDVTVLRPLWQQTWFWGAAIVLATAAAVASGRFLGWRRMKQEMLKLKTQQALEMERLRIANDIHDDLGARVTQITMVSGMSLRDPALSEKTREDLIQIKRMSRDLVSALYETVWAVNPEYDNLDALGSYLCQMVNQQCDRTPVHCRLDVSELPHDTQVSSHIRHNISMVVKEAVNNAIKHSRATEVAMNVSWRENLLNISIQDNGCGFVVDNGYSGHGLNNMKTRMQKIGGSCFIASDSGSGTIVRLNLQINPAAV